MLSVNRADKYCPFCRSRSVGRRSNIDRTLLSSFDVSSPLSFTHRLATTFLFSQKKKTILDIFTLVHWNGSRQTWCMKTDLLQLWFPYDIGLEDYRTLYFFLYFLNITRHFRVRLWVISQVFGAVYTLTNLRPKSSS